MPMNGTAIAPTSDALTTRTSTTTRTNITAHESRIPQASASPSPAAPASRLRRANESVTAVDETNPPVTPVSAAPRPVPSQRVAM